MKYFDAHCHIQFEEYDIDREVLLERMKEEKVGGMFVGTHEESSARAIALAKEAGENFYASVGHHPNYAHTYTEVSVYAKLAQEERVVAIGECGLDYFRPESVEEMKPIQKKVFKEHIALAASLHKPLMIHARPSKGSMDAYEDALTLLEEAKQQEGKAVHAHFHFFVGNTAIAKKIVDFGCTVSYPAIITFTHDYDEVISSLPLDHILSETDAPYASPKERRGTRNDPLAVIEVVRAIARIRGENEEVVRNIMLENTRRVFLSK